MLKNFIFKNFSLKLNNINNTNNTNNIKNLNKQLNFFQSFSFARKNSNITATSLTSNTDNYTENNQDLNTNALMEKKEKSFSIKNQKNQKKENKDKEIQGNLMNKNINILKEEVIVSIKPYFPNAVSEKEKSSTHIDSSKMEEGKKIKKDKEQSGINSLEVLKNKRIDKKKIAATRKASLFMQNIKRELPEDL
jgi:hypothetical protein